MLNHPRFPETHFAAAMAPRANAVRSRAVCESVTVPVAVGRTPPHATRVAAMWATLTRLKKPIPDRYPQEVRALADQKIAPYAGSGKETLTDGVLRRAAFAQPSGVASDGKYLYVADRETSSLRRVPLDPVDAKVETLVGRGLFVFGDEDGPGQVADDPLMIKPEARLQHALGVVHVDGKLYVADTYNSKIKVFDLKSGQLTTLVSGRPFGPFGPTVFNEPGGISYADGKLYVADTNAHRIRVIDLATKAVSTLQLKGVDPPPAPKKK